MDKKKKTSKAHTSSMTKMIFGHEKIDQKDIIDTLIIVLFTVFMSFMHLKLNNTI